MQRKAVRFVEDVLGDFEKAEEISDLSPEEYAERKRIRIVDNPTKDGKGLSAMANRKKQELEDLLEDVGGKVAEMLNPSLTRTQIVVLAQEIDEMVNGSDEDEDDDIEDDDDE
jgi:hypothetical protein